MTSINSGTVVPRSAADHAQKVKLTYRPEIDGLRGLAILLVVCYHAFPDLMPGGFIGVDVFFVISGFLITSLLQQGLIEGHFSFLNFFYGRVRRLFPALIIVLTFSLGIGWFVLLPDELEQLGKHAMGGAGFVANIVLWQEFGYFDNAAVTKPLLHLWSLGVEEQFYLTFPFLLWFVWKFRLNLLAILLILGIGSFLVNINLSDDYSKTAFYSPLSRFWEILLGGIVACLPAQELRVGWHKKLAVGLGWVSLLGLIAASLFVTADSRFPGYIALLPTLATAFIIFFSTPALNYIFSCRPIVWIGLISYPLYLWHWPLISYLNIAEFQQPSTAQLLMTLAAACLLATLTYKFVETPIRKISASWTRLTVGLIAMLCVGFLGFTAHSNEGFKWRTTEHQNAKDVRSWCLKCSERVEYCSSEFKQFYTNAFCGSTNNPEVVIFGDSHAGALYSGFIQSQNKTMRNAMVLGAGACHPILEDEFQGYCAEFVKEAIRKIGEMDSVQKVFLTGDFSFTNNGTVDQVSAYLQGYAQSIRAIQSSGKEVVFIKDVPLLPFDPQACVSDRPIHALYDYQKPNTCYGIDPDTMSSREAYDEFVENLSSMVEAVEVYDPYNLICDTKCGVFKDGKLLYGDNNHLSIHGAKLVMDNYAE